MANKKLRNYGVSFLDTLHSTRYKAQFSDAISDCYCAVKLRTIFSSRTLFAGHVKDRSPIHHIGNVIYKFLCSCDSMYVGRTSQRLHLRMKEHVPPAFLEYTRAQQLGRLSKTKSKSKKTTWSSLSSIGKHFNDSPSCAVKYDPNNFTVLARGRTAFHLKVLEAMYIKTLAPDLCVQKKFVHSVLLFKGSF